MTKRMMWVTIWKAVLISQTVCTGKMKTRKSTKTWISLVTEVASKRTWQGKWNKTSSRTR